MGRYYKRTVLAAFANEHGVETVSVVTEFLAPGWGKFSCTMDGNGFSFNTFREAMNFYLDRGYDFIQDVADFNKEKKENKIKTTLKWCAVKCPNEHYGYDKDEKIIPFESKEKAVEFADNEYKRMKEEGEQCKAFSVMLLYVDIFEDGQCKRAKLVNGKCISPNYDFEKSYDV